MSGRVAAPLFAVLLAACRGQLGEGLPAEAVKALEPCLAQSGEVRDHCAVAVSAQLDLTGDDWLRLCGQLGGGTAYDLCIERAVWTEKAPAPHAVCDKIDNVRTRQSCLLGASNALVEGPIPPLVDVCARTEDLETDCWVHVTTERRYFWLDKGQQQLLDDIAEAVKLRPALAASVPFASEVGRAQGRLPVAPDYTVCDNFEPQIPRMTCRNNIQGGLR